MADKRSDDKYLADLDLIDQVENEKLQQGIDLIEDEGYEEDNGEFWFLNIFSTFYKIIFCF